MSLREQFYPTDYGFVEINGQEYLFPNFSRHSFFERYSGEGYPCSNMEDFISILAEKYWLCGVDVIKKIDQSPAFKTVKRDPGKTLTVAFYYHSISNGGAQRVTALLSSLLAEQINPDGTTKYKIVLITDERTDDQVEEFTDDSDEEEYDYSRFIVGPQSDYEISDKITREYLPARAVSEAANYRSRFQAWSRIIDEHSVDIVVSGMWVDTFTFWDMLSVKGQPSHPAFILQNHSFCCVPFSYTGNTAVRLVKMFSFCDAVVVLSETDKRYVENFCPRTRYIQNPLSVVSDDDISSYEPDTILWVGRFSGEKRPGEALTVLHKILGQKPDVKMLFVGTGDINQVKDLVNKANDLGLDENIEFTGFSTNIDEYYKKASVVICTSKYEGFPTSCVEALSYGVPIVEYEMPWLTISQDGRGLLSVPQNDTTAMAEAVIELLDDPDRIKRMGCEGKEMINELSKIDIVSEWNDLFDSVFVPVTEQRDPDLLIKYLVEYQQFGKDLLSKRLKAETVSAKKYSSSLNNKLNRTYKEKTEINAKLQRTYKEKSAINAELKKTREEKKELSVKLKEAKAKNKQIKAELQKEIEENKSLNAKYKSVKNSEVKNEKKLKAIKNSRSYKIGRVITAPVRGIKKLFKK